MINRACWALIIVLLSVPAGLAGASETDVVSGVGIAVIVNADNPVDQLSLADLQRIVLGERRSWSARIPLVQRRIARAHSLVAESLSYDRRGIPPVLDGKDLSR
jgi:hypothetical protein